MTRLPVLPAALLLASIAACAGGPRPIVAGDPCARCHMPVADERWGAELVTRTGVVRKYDAIECLARDLEEAVVAPHDVASLWVVPFDAPGTLVSAEEAVYLRGGDLRSPMGMNLTALTPGSDATALVAQHGAEVLDWAGVQSAVAAQRAVAGSGHAH